MADDTGQSQNLRTGTAYALAPGAAFLTVGLGLLATAIFRHGALGGVKPLLYQLSGAALIAGAAFTAAGLTIQAVGQPRRTPRTVHWHVARRVPRMLNMALHHLTAIANRVLAVNWLQDWLPVASTVLLSLAALFALVQGWRLPGAPPAAHPPWIMAALAASAFPLLALERRFAGLAARQKPHAQALTYLLRLLLFTLIGLAAAQALRWFALPFPRVVERLVLAFDGLVALELALRGLIYLFMPLPPLAARQPANSLIASVLRLQRPSLRAIQASMTSQLGIDLGRSWALGYIRRALLPMLGGMAVAGWLLTGVTTLELGQRAIYEVFGNPQTVSHPGLHIYLPWPVGRLKPVEYGTTHAIAIAFPDEEIYGPAMKVKTVAEKPTIEGRQPASANRLWEASRPTEASYLVASNQNGRETFEVINIDLRVVYRIGLSDQAAMRAVYGLTNPADIIRTTAGRMLARYFARYTLAAILGQDRERFIRGFQKELQARLDVLTGSIDILGVVIETIHPPAGTAEAYQQVQAAGIDAVTKVANARGDAVRAVRQAEADAIEARDGAVAQAAETVADAKVGTALFAGDAEAYRAGGQAFLFEKRLSNLMAAITPDTPVTILDSRIPAGQLQMLQMRPPSTTPGNGP